MPLNLRSPSCVAIQAAHLAACLSAVTEKLVQKNIQVVDRLVALPTGMHRNPIEHDLVVFLDQVIFPRLPEGEDEEHEPEEHFQQRVEQALSYVHGWDWKREELKYLEIVGKLIRF
ncbi:hypothetical protein RJZ90_002763 [Blastomyces dermatitidis]